MNHILIIGAGRSTTSLINYLLELSDKLDLHITLADMDVELAKSKINGHGRGEAIEMNVSDEISRVRQISKADLVISMLPAHMHVPVATDCIALGKP